MNNVKFISSAFFSLGAGGRVLRVRISPKKRDNNERDVRKLKTIGVINPKRIIKTFEKKSGLEKFDSEFWFTFPQRGRVKEK